VVQNVYQVIKINRFTIQYWKEGLDHNNIVCASRRDTSE
jgi:hypothetical protein